MKCPKCQYESNKNSKFCVRCGTPLQETKKKQNLKQIGIILAIIVIVVILFFVIINATSTHDSSNTIVIDGVEFEIPEKGYFKSENKYHFNFTNHTCSVRQVEFFESEDSSNPPLEPIKLSKYYPGSESYIHTYDNGATWCGLKIKKDSSWFHMSMKTDDPDEAIKLFDWMYEHNTWEGHD